MLLTLATLVERRWLLVDVPPGKKTIRLPPHIGCLNAKAEKDVIHLPIVVSAERLYTPQFRVLWLLGGRKEGVSGADARNGGGAKTQHHSKPHAH